MSGGGEGRRVLARVTRSNSGCATVSAEISGKIITQCEPLRLLHFPSALPQISRPIKYIYDVYKSLKKESAGMSSLKRKGKVQVEETRDKNNSTEHEDFFFYFLS